MESRIVRDGEIGRVSYRLETLQIEIQHGAVHVKGTRHQERLFKFSFAQDKSTVAGVLRGVDAFCFGYDFVFGHAQRLQDTSGNFCLRARIAVDLPAAYQDWNVQHLLKSDRRQKSVGGAGAQRSHSVNIGHLTYRAASQKDNHICSRSFDLRGRRVQFFKPTHKSFRDEPRAQQIKNQRDDQNRDWKFPVDFEELDAQRD